jgi:hypothetical protein
VKLLNVQFSPVKRVHFINSSQHISSREITDPEVTITILFIGNTVWSYNIRWVSWHLAISCLPLVCWKKRQVAIEATEEGRNGLLNNSKYKRSQTVVV